MILVETVYSHRRTSAAGSHSLGLVASQLANSIHISRADAVSVAEIPTSDSPLINFHLCFARGSDYCVCVHRDLVQVHDLATKKSSGFSVLHLAQLGIIHSILTHDLLHGGMLAILTTDAKIILVPDLLVTLI